MNRRDALKAAVAGVAGACYVVSPKVEPRIVHRYLFQRITSETWCSISWPARGKIGRYATSARIESHADYQALMRCVPKDVAASEVTYEVFCKTVPEWVEVESYHV